MLHLTDKIKFLVKLVGLLTTKSSPSTKDSSKFNIYGKDLSLEDVIEYATWTSKDLDDLTNIQSTRKEIKPTGKTVTSLHTKSLDPESMYHGQLVYFLGTKSNSLLMSTFIVNFTTDKDKCKQLVLLPASVCDSTITLKGLMLEFKLSTGHFYKTQEDLLEAASAAMSKFPNRTV